MVERARLRIRSIYSTALTDILLERGFVTVSPSPAISKRFALAPVPNEAQVTLYDRSDKQEIVVEGQRCLGNSQNGRRLPPPDQPPLPP